MIRWSWSTMGSVASLAVPGNSTPSARSELEVAVRAAQAWLNRAEAALSPYRADSDLRRWREGRAPLADLSPLLDEVVETCTDLGVITGGGFQPVDPTGEYDPSGYVKGWAVQRAAQVLTEAGVSDVCLGVGGDIQMRGTSDGGRPWRTAIGDPGDRRRIAAVLENPVDGSPFAVATSGAAQRGAHIWGAGPVDPRVSMDRPTSAAGLASVTVVGPDLGRVDAFATAIWGRALHEPLAGAWSWLAGTGCEALAIDDSAQAHLTGGMRSFLHTPAVQARTSVPALD